jgi:uncharacterized protein with von Willebrand factor type A (vWA) domain
MGYGGLNMSWEDILKIEPYERATAEEFAEEDMDEWRDGKHRKKLEADRLNEELQIEKFQIRFAKIKDWMEDNEDTSDEDIQDAIELFNALMERAERKQELKHYQTAWATILHWGKGLDIWPIRNR